MNPIPENHGNKIALILFCYVLFTIRFAQAQCIAVGPNSPGTSASVSFTGSDFDFNNPANCLISDNNRATATPTVFLLSGQTEYLQATNFGFSIPTAATICGIEVNIERSATNLLLNFTSVTDNNVRIIKNGTRTGTNLANTSDPWPADNDATATYGNNNELWGTSWSPTDINSSNFGIAVSAQITGIVGLLPSARINHISMTVYYLDPSVLSTSDTVRSTVKPVKVTDNAPIKCYPNPFTSFIQVAGVVAGERVSVTDIYGQRLYLSAPAVSTTIQIDVNNLRPGIYVISTGKQKMKIQKK